MKNYHLSHLDEVNAAIRSAGRCRSIEELTTAIHAFESAPLATSTRAVPGRAGSRCTAQNPVMVLGKSPAATETETGQLFAGQAGLVLRDMFDGAGYDLESCWLTSASPWRPRKDNTPNASQLAFSRPFLFKEIELVQPSVIVCLGEKALEALTQEAGVFAGKAGTEIGFELRGRTIPVRIMMNHAFAMRSPQDRVPAFRQHLRDAAKAHPQAFDTIAHADAIAA